MLSLLVFAYTASTVVNKVASKTCSNVVAAKSNRIKYFVYLTLVGIIACGALFVINGFKISFTLPTLYYALAFSVICMRSVICHLEMFKLTNITGALVLSSMGSLVATSAIGFFLFREDVSGRTLLKIGIMLIPAVLTLIEAGQKSNDSKKKERASASLKLVIFTLLLVVAGSGNTIIIKLYSNAENVTDISSMFFFTNVIQAVISLALLSFFILKRRRGESAQVQIRSAVGIFRPIPLLAVMANTVASNATSLLGAKLIERMAVSLYTPLSSAITIIAGVIASFIYREHHGVLFYLSAIIAIVAVVI